jgi:helicase MOV-10
MILSTVRSSHELLTYDLRHTLGFVSNPRRFNGTWLFYHRQ